MTVMRVSKTVNLGNSSVSLLHDYMILTFICEGRQKKKKQEQNIITVGAIMNN